MKKTILILVIFLIIICGSCTKKVEVIVVNIGDTIPYGIQIATDEGGLNKAATKIMIAPVEGGINKEVTGVQIAPVQEIGRAHV